MRFYGRFIASRESPMRRAATIPVFLMALVVAGSVLADCRALPSPP